VRTMTFRDPTGSNVDHAEEIDSLVSELMTETGAAHVDIVAHSMGGLATRWYLNTHPDAPVRRVAFLATPHQGTLSAHVAWGDGRDEMLPESLFLEALNHVLPGESATLRGVVDYVVCCPTHSGLLDDDDVFVILLDFLEGRAGTSLSSERR
jgi:triacylglycerol esterase/lipase EstA (alpha/beta hydrolase family)